VWRSVLRAAGAAWAARGKRGRRRQDVCALIPPKRGAMLRRVALFAVGAGLGAAAADPAGTVRACVPRQGACVAPFVARAARFFAASAPLTRNMRAQRAAGAAVPRTARAVATFGLVAADFRAAKKKPPGSPEHAAALAAVRYCVVLPCATRVSCADSASDTRLAVRRTSARRCACARCATPTAASTPRRRRCCPRRRRCRARTASSCLRCRTLRRRALSLTSTLRCVPSWARQPRRSSPSSTPSRPRQPHSRRRAC
jgi:hypothetical protein